MKNFLQIKTYQKYSSTNLAEHWSFLQISMTILVCELQHRFAANTVWKPSNFTSQLPVEKKETHCFSLIQTALNFLKNNKKNQTHNKQAKTESQVTYYFIFAKESLLPLASKILLLTSINFSVNIFFLSLLFFRLFFSIAFLVPWALITGS